MLILKKTAKRDLAVRKIQILKEEIPLGLFIYAWMALLDMNQLASLIKADTFKAGVHESKCTQRYTRDKVQSDHPNNLRLHWRQVQVQQQSFQLTNR